MRGDKNSLQGHSNFFNYRSVDYRLPPRFPQDPRAPRDHVPQFILRVAYPCLHPRSPREDSTFLLSFRPPSPPLIRRAAHDAFYPFICEFHAVGGEKADTRTTGISNKRIYTLRFRHLPLPSPGNVYAEFADNEIIDRPRAEMKGRRWSVVSWHEGRKRREGGGSNLIRGRERDWRGDEVFAARRKPSPQNCVFRRRGSAAGNSANVTSYSTLRHSPGLADQI